MLLWAVPPFLLQINTTVSFNAGKADFQPLSGWEMYGLESQPAADYGKAGSHLTPAIALQTPSACWAKCIILE